MTAPDVADLFKRIEMLSAPDRLRLAADLIDHGKTDIAAQLVRRTHELVGFQRWVIGAYDKRIGWDEWKRAAWRPEKLGDRTNTQRALPLWEPIG